MSDQISDYFDQVPDNETKGPEVKRLAQSIKANVHDTSHDGLKSGDKHPFERLKLKVGPETAVPNLADNWAIHLVLPLNSFIAIYGAPGSGKSVIVLDMALHVASGRDWCGREVEKGLVIYAALEGTAVFQNRVAAAVKNHELTDEELASFSTINVGLDLQSANQDRDRIIDAAKILMKQTGQPIRIVVIDTLNRAFGGGNENSPEDMGRLIQHCGHIMQELGCSVVLVHHSGKDMAQGMRGHSSLLGAIDTEIKIERKDGGRLMTISKQKEGEDGEQFGFVTDAVDVGETTKGRTVSGVIAKMKDARDIKDQSKKAPKGKNQKIIMDALCQLAAVPGAEKNPSGTGWPEPGTRTIVPIEGLLAHAKGKLPPPEAGKADKRRDNLKRALETLIECGTLCSTDGHVWNPRSQIGDDQ